MEIHNKSVDLLIPYDKNTKKHDKTQINNVAESIKQYGFVQPIVIDKENVVVIGHCRLLAAKQLKMKEVPCVCVEDLTEEQVKALRIVDNKSNESEWDFDFLADELAELDLSDFDFDFGIEDEEEETEIVEDEAPEVDEDAEPIAKLGDIWQLGKHRLMCGDSTDKATVELLMDGKKADMVMTDPPYGMFLDTDYSKMSGYEGCGNKYDKVIGDNEDFNPELIKTVFDNFGYVKEVFLWGADYYAEHLKEKNNGSWVVWDKRENENTEKNVDNRFGSMFELCWSKEKHRREIIRFMWAGMMKQSDFDNGRNHPTQKPAKMLGNLIKDFSENGNLIVDLYGGSGSTLIACEQLDRTCYMMELDPKYCDVIIKRWETFTGEKAVKLN
jgi:site-specific DNA-methyltransferase (adenine-specific)